MTTVKCKGNSMFTQYKLCILGSINLVIDKNVNWSASKIILVKHLMQLIDLIFTVKLSSTDIRTSFTLVLKLITDKHQRFQFSCKYMVQFGPCS